MTLEEYIKKNYKEEPILSYDKWLLKQVDFNNNGKVDVYEYRTNKKGKQVWTGRYSKEDNEYKRLQKDPNTYTNWEGYVQTITQTNAERLRQVKAVWEASQAYEKGSVEAQDAFNRDNQITTIQETEQAINIQNQQMYMKKILLIGGISLIAFLILMTFKKK